MRKLMTGVLGGVLLCFFCVGVALAAVTLTPTPRSGPPTKAVRVTAAAFGANEAVDVYLDTTDLALAVSDASGRISCTVTIPATTLPGTHWITAVDRKSGLAAQAEFIVRTNWVEFGGDGTRAGHNATENILGRSTVEGLYQIWESPKTDGFSFSSPTVVNGVIYIGSYEGILYAFRLATGTLKWKAALDLGYIESTPAVSGPYVYVGATDGRVHAFKRTDGTKVWESTIGGSILSAPAVDVNSVYVGGTDSRVYALDKTTGSLRWSAVAGKFGVRAGLAVVRNTVYVGTGDGQVCAFDAATGNQKWARRMDPAGCSGTPAVVDGVVYASTTNGWLCAFKAVNGRRLWRTSPGSGFRAGPAVARGVVYITDGDGGVNAFDAQTGEMRWRNGYMSPTGFMSSPTVAGGVLYVAENGSPWLPDDKGGRAYALNTADGEVLWAGMAGTGATSTPTVVDGVLLVSSLDGRVHAFGIGSSYPDRPKAAPDSRPNPAALLPDFTLAPQK